MTATAPPQTARYERKREAILEAAAKLFNARGLNGTTIADVAQGVGLTTTSVTYYYRKKEDLAAACVLRAVETMEDLGASAAAAATPPARLIRFIHLYFELLAEVAEGRKPAIINFWDLRAMTEAGSDTARAAFTALFRHFRRWFDDPSLPELTRDERNARTHFIFSAVLWAKEWLTRFETEDYPRVADRFADVLVNGLAGPGADWAVMAIDPPPPRPQTTEVSREAFLRAATELVNEQGYRGASVDRISAKLRVTKGSFYHHNENKDDLVAQCFDRTFAFIRAAHRVATPEIGTGWVRLCTVATSLVRHQLSVHGPLLRYSALSAMPEAMRPTLLRDFDRLSQRTAGIIVDGIADRSIRPIDPTIAAQLVTGMINAAAELHHWVHGASEQTGVDLFVRPSLVGVFVPPTQA
jgi:AcrR family transcriptional regulator